MIHLSKRLNAIADMVPEGVRLADIGTDHAYIPIYLAQTHQIVHAVAMDINQGPLEKAKKHIQETGLSDMIETRLSDGLQYLKPDEVDVVLIAGMGGPLMSRILVNGRHVLDHVHTLILQPQSEIPAFRRFLHNQGYRIVDEQMLIDDGKYYVIFKVEPGTETYDSDVEYAYGRILLKKQDKTVEMYIQKELRSATQILTHLETQTSDGAKQRTEDIKHKIWLARKALTYFGGSESGE